jgi:hypothetical protein
VLAGLDLADLELECFELECRERDSRVPSAPTQEGALIRFQALFRRLLGANRDNSG